ncbi:universal stress protein [Thermodesulfobacteriota bacterium]
MGTLKILFPYNFTMHDKKALEFLNKTFARLSDVQITIFNAYTPVTEMETGDESVMARMKSNINFLHQKLVEKENELKIVQNQLQKGFSESQVRYIFKPRKKKDIATEIVDLASYENFDIIILNRKPAKITRFFTGSIFSKVVNGLPDKIVCIVT